MDAIDAKFDAKFEALHSEFSALHSEFDSLRSEVRPKLSDFSILRPQAWPEPRIRRNRGQLESAYFKESQVRNLQAGLPLSQAESRAHYDSRALGCGSIWQCVAGPGDYVGIGIGQAC